MTPKDAGYTPEEIGMNLRAIRGRLGPEGTANRYPGQFEDMRWLIAALSKAEAKLKEAEDNRDHWRLSSKDHAESATKWHSQVKALEAKLIEPTYHEGHECCRKCVMTLAAMTKERDALKKAKAENDERFMIERDEARQELAAKEKELAEAKCHDCEVFRGSTLKAAIHQRDAATSMLSKVMTENRENAEALQSTAQSEAQLRLALDEAYEALEHQAEYSELVDRISRVASLPRSKFAERAQAQADLFQAVKEVAPAIAVVARLADVGPDARKALLKFEKAYLASIESSIDKGSA